MGCANINRCVIQVVEVPPKPAHILAQSGVPAAVVERSLPGRAAATRESEAASETAQETDKKKKRATPAKTKVHCLGQSCVGVCCTASRIDVPPLPQKQSLGGT